MLTCLQGGFIWDWVDQGLLHKVKDAEGKEVEAWGYGGDFGDPVHDAQFCINGLIWPNRVPHPGAYECKAVMVKPFFIQLSVQRARLSARVRHGLQ